jgi:hypothetical protein
MTAADHRRRERQHLSSVRYAIRHKDYDMAFRTLVWAHQQSVAAETKEAIVQRDKSEKKAKRNR